MAVFEVRSTAFRFWHAISKRGCRAKGLRPATGFAPRHFMPFAVALASVLTACATPAPPLSQPLRFGPTEVPALGFHQRCLTLQATERLGYDFQAEPPLILAIEYRERDMAFQPLRLDASHGETGRFLPEATREYCVRWENPNTASASLRYHLRAQ